MARGGLKKQPQRHSLRPRAPSGRSFPPGSTADSARRESLAPSQRSTSIPPAVAPEAREPVAVPAKVADAKIVETKSAEPKSAEPTERLSDQFFSSAPGMIDAETWDDAPLPPMSRGSRLAMRATIGILAASALSLSVYWVHQRLIMPVPVEFGAGANMPPALPVPDMPKISEEPKALAAAAPTPAAPTEPVQVLAAAVAEPSAAAPEAPAEEPAPAQEPVAATPTEAAPIVDADYTSQLADADVLRGRGRSKEARAAYEQLLTAHPDAPDLLRKLAFTYLDGGDNTRAQELAARSAELDATSAEAWIVLGAAREGLHDRSGAKAAYQTCADLADAKYSTECRRLIR